MTQQPRQPYTLVGSDQLTASVYKTGDELTGFAYRFNVTRLNNRTGRVNQWFTPSDICGLVKLTRVLAAELAIDGCTTPELRAKLFRIASALDEAITEISSTDDIGATHS